MGASSLLPRFPFLKSIGKMLSIPIGQGNQVDKKKQKDLSGMFLGNCKFQVPFE